MPPSKGGGNAGKPKGGKKPPRKPPRPAAPPPWVGLPPAGKPMYSDYLGFAPTFNWGGTSWGAGDQSAFEAYLRRHGINPARWYANHRTAGKVFDPTEQAIYGMFQPQLSAIDAERKRAADMYANRIKNVGGFAQALMPYLNSVPGAIMDPYRQGGAGVESAAAGYGGRLNADSAAEAAAANEVIKNAGLPGGVEGGDAGGVLAGLGSMQGDLMRAAGGGYGAAASLLPHTASLEALQMVKDIQSEAAAADKGFSQNVLEVLQGLPGARQQLSQQTRSERFQQQKFALDQLKEEHDWYKEQAALALAAGDNRRAQQYLKLAQQREDRYRMASQGLDVNGNPKPGYHIDPKTGLVTKDAGKGSTSSTTPGTPAWRAKQLVNVGKAQKDIRKDVDQYMKSIGATDAPPKNIGGYSGLSKQLWERYKYLATTPTAKKALRRAIEQAIRSWRPEPKKGGATAGGALPTPEG